MTRTVAPSAVRTLPVLAIVVCHDGEEWLPLALSSLRRSTIRPRHVLAVDTGSTDRTAKLLAEAAEPGGVAAGPDAQPVLSGALTLSSETGFAAAIAAAVDHAVERWGDPGSWLWLLHDDCAPEPDCLEQLLHAADENASAKVLGPLGLDWAEPRLIVEAGLSTDASGHRQQMAAPGDEPSEVLAVSSAGSLVQRELWTELGGFDPEFALLREDLDFGWRANAAGALVLSVPAARVRHARALSTGHRAPDAAGRSLAAVNRSHGLRVFLVNCSASSFWFGLVRLPVLLLLRAFVFVVLRRTSEARAELSALRYLTSGRGHLRKARAARRQRPRPGTVKGLFVGRLARLRNAVRAGVVGLVRRGVERDVALGTVPEGVTDEPAWIPPEALGAANRPPVGPEALPAGALRGLSSRGSGLRRPGTVVAVTVPAAPGVTVPAAPGATGPKASETEAPAGETSPDGPTETPRPAPAPRPSPARDPGLVFVEVNRRRVLGATVFAPPVVLTVLLTALAFAVNRARLGLDLSGGTLLPVGGLGQVWSTYLSPWHAVSGGTGAPAPATLPVLGSLGAIFTPLGGPAALVAILLIGDVPLAFLSAYAATRKLPVRRWVRAIVAATYALLPAATASVAQGRLDVVVVHLVLPLVVAGIARLLTRPGTRWLHVSALSAFGVALLGAFSPLAHALALLGLLVGFVVLPAPTGLGRRAASVGIVVILPLVLLLPWPTVLLAHPDLLLHGLGGPAAPVSGANLSGLTPGGPGAWPIGVAVLAATLVALVVRPTKQVAGGLALAVLGVAGVVLVRQFPVAPMQGGAPAPGYTGVPLLVVGAGLLWAVLATWRRGGSASVPAPWLPKVAGVAGVVVLAALAASAVGTGAEGPLTAHPRPALAPEVAADVAASGRAVLDLTEPQPRQTGGRLALYGDDQLAPAPGTTQRLAGWRTALLTGDANAVKAAVAAAAISGVEYVVLPPGSNAQALGQLAEGLVAVAAPMSDGRPVVRLLPKAGEVTLISPELAKAAVTGGGAPGAAPGVSPVDAQLPDVRVRASAGPTGRLLVLAAEQEAGWQASVNGKAVPIVPAWGHQVAVSIPAASSEVSLAFPGTERSLLLLVQLAAVLFTALTAIPSRRQLAKPAGRAEATGVRPGRAHSPSITSGSTPR
ncbi:glycosyltransferase family 2 protein [Amycolatopsis sp. FDAARGOS 1241]|uniref:glycosyltransferase family 2 protein n=1 Tax=Amycolatopsis sp. FDAARGOS 1241 TaxID=2778070 RepID=UPI00194F2B59|nr:glycosyltransferase family 2 protein [Amycolatopsis sp. FDAARGOS 1241]QRP50598.1 glycosyltransferase family 2 protein [Amycolatopsis sp. FDAARGOS 1241]